MTRTRLSLRFPLVASAMIVVLVAGMQAHGQARSAQTEPHIRVTEVLGREDLQKSIAAWADARQGLLQTYFQKQVTIKVEQEASEFLINAYTKSQVAAGKYEERQLSPGFLPAPELSRFVVRMDLLTVLERSFENTIKANYQTLFGFLKREGAILDITVPNVQKALQEEDCEIIPCPPDKCGPDCSRNAFKRYQESPGLCPCRTPR